ncbi:hypothetical protein D3C81_479420 [compost metagenome]
MALSAQELQDQNRSEVPVQTTTNTSIGNLINKCIATGQPITIPQYTTLNEKWDMLAEQSIGPMNSRDFYLKYFTIGVRGSNCDGKDSRGVSKLKVNQHQPIDMDLFTAIPFICRPIDNDLDSINREKYRMRIVEERNGIAYAFYWVKLISFLNYNPTENKITRDPVTGLENAKPLIHKKDDLENPQPVDFTSEGNVPASNEYVNSSAILDCSLEAADLREIELASKIYYADASYGSINELGVLYGRDVTNRGAIGGNATIQYTEVASAVHAHYLTERDGRNAITNTKVQLALDHGASAPMLLHSTATINATGQGN